MSITADSTRRAPPNPLRPALLVAALLVASHAGANAQTEAHARRAATRAQKSAAPLPAFTDYPARDSFTGRPAPVRLRTRRDRRYRTVLREGAAGGPNFAGRYTVVHWGCGTGCAEVAVVDAQTGFVYWPPLQYADIPTPGGEQYDAGYAYGPGYRADSRLLVLTRSHYDRGSSYTSYFYLFDRGRFRLVGEATRQARPAEGEGDPPRNDPHDPS
jgi:hypothetical protein